MFDFSAIFTFETLLAAMVVAFAGVLRGFSGFGSAMVLAPALSALMPITQVVPLIILLEIGLSFQMIGAARQHIIVREIAIMSIAALPGLIIGALVLTHVPELILRWSISILILMFLGLVVLNIRRQGQPSDVGLGAAGLTSGVFNGASGVGGPPIALYYLAGDGGSAVVRATVIWYFFIIDSASAGIFAVQGLITHWVLIQTVIYLPAAVIGVWVGSLFFRQASEAQYRIVAYTIIAVAAILGPLA